MFATAPHSADYRSPVGRDRAMNLAGAFVDDATGLAGDLLTCYIVEVGQHQLGTFPRQHPRTCRTNTRCGTGDQPHLTIKLTHGVPPLSSLE